MSKKECWCLAAHFGDASRKKYKEVIIIPFFFYFVFIPSAHCVHYPMGKKRHHSNRWPKFPNVLELSVPMGSPAFCKVFH